MASSSTFKQPAQGLGWPDAAAMRYRGYRGGEIRMHRGMIRFRVSRTDVLQAVVIAAGLSFAWVRALPVVGKLWFAIFEYWVRTLNMEASVSMMPQHWSNVLQVSLPFVAVEAGTISPLTWIVSLFITVAVFAGTYWLSDDHAPWAYIIRALVLIQLSALVYFAFASARFPHDIPTYIMGMLSFGVILIGMIPIVLAFTYYLFDFSLWKKLGMTALLMGHLTLLFPLQYVLQVYILHHSILFMPLLYFAFGPFLDVLIFVCFYSWAMSWTSRSQQRS
ncbi:MAG: hypothetical protein ACXVZV_03430 [Terriglobales bacterium]